MPPIVSVPIFPFELMKIRRNLPTWAASQSPGVISWCINLPARHELSIYYRELSCQTLVVKAWKEIKNIGHFQSQTTHWKFNTINKPFSLRRVKPLFSADEQASSNINKHAWKIRSQQHHYYHRKKEKMLTIKLSHNKLIFNVLLTDVLLKFHLAKC